MGKNSDWYKSKTRRLNKQLQTILNEIPPFAKNYILSKITHLELKTLISYAYEIERFLNFLYERQSNHMIESDSNINVNSIKNMDSTVITELTSENAEEYIRYLRDISGNTITRSIYILNNWFKYMISKNITLSNPFDTLKTPKFKIEENVNHLSPEEIQKIFDSVINMEAGKSGHQEAYLKKTQLRDYTILLLILNTGIRVSECQGLDISDIDTRNNKISIVRKGGKSATVYISQRVSDVLCGYIKYRKNIPTKFPDEKALFLSIQKTRMTIRAIEKLIAKLAKPCLQSKKVTPTILRNTYGVELYKKTNDKELVGTMLDCVSTSARYTQRDIHIENEEASETLSILEEKNIKNNPMEE